MRRRCSRFQQGTALGLGPLFAVLIARALDKVLRIATEASGLRVQVIQAQSELPFSLIQAVVIARMRDRRWWRRQGIAAVSMFEQGRYGRHTVAARVAGADGGDWRGRALKTRWNDGGLAGESAAAIALVVNRESSAADGGTGGRGRVDFLC